MIQLKTWLMAITILFCTSFSNTAVARSMKPANNPDYDVPLTIGMSADDFRTVNSMNCDMVDAMGGKLWAVAVEGDNFNGGLNHKAAIYFQYTGIGLLAYSNTIPLSDDAYDIDLVITDNMSGTAGEDYLITVIYRNNASGNIETASFPVTGLNTIFRTHSATPINPGGVALVLTSGGTFGHPHLDAFGDLYNISFGFHQSLHEYVAVWDNSNGGYTVEMTIGDITSTGMSTVVSPFTVTIPGGISDAWQADVAAQSALTPTIGLVKTAWVTYTSSANTDLGLTQVDFNNVNTVTQTPSLLSSSYTVYGLPRIEAQALADVTSGVATWNVVANDMDAIYMYSDAYSALTWADWGFGGMCATTTTGVGPNMDVTSTGIGTGKFSVNWLTIDNPDNNPSYGFPTYISNCFEIVGEAPTPLMTNLQYKIVNYNPNYITLGLSQGSICAVATSSNSGDDLLSVWYKGVNTSGNGEIEYKFSGNNYAYKATGINNFTNNKFSIAPNPATKEIRVNGVQNSAYTISDVMGKIIDKGSIPYADAILDISDLTPGTYFINLTAKNETQTLKFVKN